MKECRNIMDNSGNRSDGVMLLIFVKGWFFPYTDLHKWELVYIANLLIFFFEKYNAICVVNCNEEYFFFLHEFA